MFRLLSPVGEGKLAESAFARLRKCGCDAERLIASGTLDDRLRLASELDVDEGSCKSTEDNELSLSIGGDGKVPD